MKITYLLALLISSFIYFDLLQTNIAVADYSEYKKQKDAEKVYQYYKDHKEAQQYEYEIRYRKEQSRSGDSLGSQIIAWIVTLVVLAPIVMLVLCGVIIILDKFGIIVPVLGRHLRLKYSVFAPKCPYPTPAKWIEWFKAEGHDVAWRYYSGEAKHVDSIPLNDYGGWYLQLVDRISIDERGLFFSSCIPRDNGFYVSLEDQDRSGAKLGAIAAKILGKLEDIEVQYGNRTLTGEEWRAYLDKKHSQI